MGGVLGLPAGQEHNPWLNCNSPHNIRHYGQGLRDDQAIACKGLNLLRPGRAGHGPSSVSDVPHTRILPSTVKQFALRAVNL